MPSVPPSFNYPNPLRLIPEIGFNMPAEGPNGVDVVLDWSIPLARGLTAFGLNLQSNTTLPFSQICGMVIDNSACGADLDFIFPDTDTTLSIPAYAPYTVVPVFTRALEFFVRANGAIAGDITNFRILNYSPRPVAVPLTVLQQTAGVTSVAVAPASSDVIIGAGINGTLQAFSITVAVPLASSSFNALFTLEDGNGSILWGGNFAQQVGGTGDNLAISLSGLNLRFINGINLVQSVLVTPGATVDANLYYKVP